MKSEMAYILLLSVAAVTVPVLSIRFAFKRPALTLIGSLVGSILFAVCGTLFSTYGYEFLIRYLLMLISAVWFPSILLIVSFAPITPAYGQTPWWKTLTRIILYLMCGILFMGGLLAVFNILGLIFFIFIVTAICRYHTVARYNRALEIVSTLVAATQQNLPLPAALQTAAMGRRDETAWIFRRIAHWLTQGCSLADAISKGYPRCLPQMLLAIESAEKINQLPQTLLSLQKDFVSDNDESKKIRPVHPWYPAMVLIAIVLMTTGLLIFIMPTFSGVLYEMSDGRERLPAPTQFLVNLSTAIMSWKAFFIAACMITVTYGVWLYYRFRTRTGYKPGPFLNLIDWIRWFWPFQNKLERNLSTLRLVEILGPAMTAGLPLPHAITAALGAKINICYKNRLNRWLQCVQSGQNIAQSARDCGIGLSIAWALDDKTNPGQAPVLLEMLEENCRFKHNYLGNLIRSVTWPLTIVMLGAFVGFIVYAMFLPMVQITIVCIQDINP